MALASLHSRLWRRLRFHYLALGWLGLVLLTLVLAPLLANPLPLRAVWAGETYYPAWQARQRGHFPDPLTGRLRDMALAEVAWHALPLSQVWWAPVRYNGQPLSKDKLLAPGEHSKLGPGRGRHWLGTTNAGIDLLGGLIHGSRLSLGVGFLAVSLALGLGLLMGSLAGFWQDHRLRLPRGLILAWSGGLFFAWFYGWDRRLIPLAQAAEAGETGLALALNLLISAAILLLAHGLGRGLSRRGWLAQAVRLPVDTLIMKLIEVLDSLPRLLLLLAIAAIFRDRSLGLVAVLLGLTAWTGLARLVRGEMLRLTQLEFIQAVEALGLPSGRILRRHLLPHALTPVYIWIALSLGGAMVAESALSFLGLVKNAPSWGGLLADAMSKDHAWWIVLFPGTCLFLTVLSFTILGEWLRDRLDPRHWDRSTTLTSI